MFKKQIASAVLLIGGIMSSSYLFSQNKQISEDRSDDSADYGGICCQKAENICVHPNGMTFLDAKWYSGGSYCP